MTEQWLRKTLEASGLKLPDAYPRDLVTSVSLNLPVAFVMVGGLTTAKIEQWLAARRVFSSYTGYRRRLHGALVARSGRGLIFVDSTDSLKEQRFTVAHEAAHFIEDHLLPRRHAVNVLGEGILLALNGERAPTPEESLSAVLNRVPLGIQMHLMDRSADGAICSWEVEEREQRADRLALEIIAPAKVALRELKRTGHLPMGEIKDGARILSDCFGLPMSAAVAYRNLLVRKLRARPKLTETLVGGTAR